MMMVPIHYGFVFEPQSMANAIQTRVSNILGLKNDELQMFNAFRKIHLLRIIKKYRIS